MNPKDVQYAQNRYETMTFKQLHTRLGRMTNRDKLVAFAHVVMEDLMRLLAIGDIHRKQINNSDQFNLLVAINTKLGLPTVVVPPERELKKFSAVFHKPAKKSQSAEADTSSEPKRKLNRRRLRV
tara:strand:+ start:77 stop:451 length:375 start_codon:yes stop_codon:yes gene_type:complete